MAPENNKLHILIVDDDEKILKLLQKYLIQNGYIVSASNNPQEAIGLFEYFKFDLVILDVMMPGITGIEFAKQLRDFDYDIPIVILTALSEIEHKIQGLEAGANDFITKPFLPRELILRINNLISLHQANKSAQNQIQLGAKIYNLKNKKLTQNDKVIKLSNSEESLLEILFEHNKTPINREKIAKLVGAQSARSVDVLVARLRLKIEEDPKNPEHIKTIRNEGYVLLY